MTIQTKSQEQVENFKSLFSLEMKKDEIYQMAVKVERELNDLRRINEDLMADIKVYESNRRPRQKREKVGYEPGQRGLPKGVSRLDYAEWKATYGQNVPADKRPVDAYQEAIASGAWVVSVKPKATRNSSGVGRGQGAWSGRKTQDQLAAQNGGWPAMRDNMNIEDSKSAPKLTATIFFRFNEDLLTPVVAEDNSVQ